MTIPPWQSTIGSLPMISQAATGESFCAASDFHISEISTTKNVFCVVDGFYERSYNRFVKAFDSTES
jgi:hypothetical protein